MPKPIFKSLTLEEARGHVATAFDIAPDEAAECINVWLCFEGLTLIGPGHSRVTVNDDANFDFESSVLSQRGRQTKAITDESPFGESDWLEIPVRVDREDLDEFIQRSLSENGAGKSGDGAAVRNTVAAQTKLPATASPDAPPKATPRHPGRPSQGPKMNKAFIDLRDLGKLNISMSKKEIHNFVMQHLFRDRKKRRGFSYDSFVKHVGPAIDTWQLH